MSKAIFNAYAEAGGNFWAQFAADSPLEEARFELPVPLVIGALRHPENRAGTLARRGLGRPVIP